MSTPVSSRPVVGLFTFLLVTVLAAGCGLFVGSPDNDAAAAGRRDLDVTFGNWVSFIKAQQAGMADLRFISESYLSAPDSNFAVIAGKDSGITGPKDLAGKKVAVNALKNINELLLRAVLDANNVDFGQKAFGDKNQKAVAAFQRAVLKGQQLTADRGNIEKALPKFAKMDAETAAVVKVGQFPTTIDPQRLQRVADLLVTYGMPGERVAMEPLVIPVPTPTG